MLSSSKNNFLFHVLEFSVANHLEFVAKFMHLERKTGKIKQNKFENLERNFLTKSRTHCLCPLLPESCVGHKFCDHRKFRILQEKIYLLNNIYTFFNIEYRYSLFNTWLCSIKRNNFPSIDLGISKFRGFSVINKIRYTNGAVPNPFFCLRFKYAYILKKLNTKQRLHMALFV